MGKRFEFESKKNNVISDYVNRKHFCDYFVNQNVDHNKKKLVKKFLPKKCQIFLGPEYHCLTKNIMVLKIRSILSQKN